jgi:nucleoside 2-deoxyribosyltransferase
MNIYFAAAIRGGRNDKELYSRVIKFIAQYGTVLTEHVGDMTLSIIGEDKAVADIYNRDMEWLKSADILVAEITTPSLGVGYELGKAEEFGKPVLCLARVVEGRRHSAMITGNKNFTIKFYHTLDDVSKILQQFFSNLI